MQQAEGQPGPEQAGALSLSRRFAMVRHFTHLLCARITPEDGQVQSMADASPTKWHLAHTSWFFEQFVLRAHVPKHKPFDANYDRLFNSYYHSVGVQHPRAQRGVLSRPSLAEILRYRAHVTDAVQALIARAETPPEAMAMVELGIHHEQQHQELVLTDIKHAFSCNPAMPAYQAGPIKRQPPAPALQWVERPEGFTAVGHAGPGFGFDNEQPHHRVWLPRFALASRPVTNGEFMEFILEGGYCEPRWWLADGWDIVEKEGWTQPLYWLKDLFHFTLCGRVDMDPSEPVCHVSYYEADAYARWKGARLPREAEWEAFAREWAVAGNFVESGRLHPASAPAGAPVQMFGDVWEWTASPYTAYPGYVAPAGAIGEYNGKFMSNQMVLRGGSCVTSASHLRPTYRNFFPPAARWQFSGFRLAKDVS